MAEQSSIAASGHRILPNQWGLVAIARASHGISAPLPPPDVPAVSLDYSQLPYYALRTTLRMFAALIASFLFTFTYATLAAKSRRWEMVLIPLLDICLLYT